MYKCGLCSYKLVSVVKSFFLYFPHVQLVLLALIFVTSIPFPLWVTEWASPSCLACAAAVVCFLSFCPWFLLSILLPEVETPPLSGRRHFWKTPEGMEKKNVLPNCQNSTIYKTNFSGMLSKQLVVNLLNVTRSPLTVLLPHQMRGYYHTKLHPAWG